MIVRFDGASRGNPGPAAIGYTLTAEMGGGVCPAQAAEHGECIGTATNNEAEYIAVIRALERAQELEAAQVTVKGDSQLVVRQLRGEYDVNAENLQPLHERASDLLDGFEHVEIQHVERAENEKADELANRALDRRCGIRPSDSTLR